MSDPSTKQRIRAFLEQNFYIADKSLLVDDASLLDRGIVDSTGILEIVAFLESDFGVKVEDHELVPDNLDSIERLEAFVAKKQAG